MNADIDEDTVSFSPNYDNKLKEPDVLPSAIPNLLVNGASGIAVGMATNMITHNLGEVVAAAKYFLKHPDATLDDLMRFVPGPDLPGGGIIIGRDGIREAYETGRGRFVTRAKIHLENITARKKGIVVTELPFMVGPEKVLERISDAVRSKKLDGITGAIDLSDRHNGMKIIIEIKSGFNPEAVLAQLYKHTPLQDSYTINNVALVDGRPHTLGLRELLRVWVDHRRVVIKARSEFRRKKALERLHLVEGLLLALIDIDEVIEVIRSSDDVDTAKSRLMAVFDLDDIQATYILDLRLRRLTKMSRVELESERDELRKKIAALEEILASQESLDKVVVEEMDSVVAQWGTPRRTLLLDHDGTVVVAEPDPSAPLASTTDATASGTSAISIGVGAGATAPTQDSVSGFAISGAAGNAAGSTKAGTPASLELEDTPCTVMLSANGLIARTTPSAVDLFETRDAATPRAAEDEIRSLFPTTTRSEYGIITSAGRLVKANVSDLPLLAASESLSVAGGVRAADLLHGTESTDPIEGERVVAAISLDATALETATPLALGTRYGVVKRWNMEAPTTMDSWSVISLKQGDDDSSSSETGTDEVLAAAPAADTDRLVFVATDASLLTFDASSVRPQGRSSAGMTGIKLNEGQTALAFAVIPAGKIAWSAPEEVTDTEADETVSSPQPTGAVVLTVAGDSKALPGTEEGFAKVTPFELYPTKGRSTRGVRAQRFLKGQDTLITAAVGTYPLHASTESGRAVELPAIDMRRDGSGTELAARIATIA
jgi:DNA gyrase subunit A